jgi:proteasome lid subunit RPN8/RPN11
MLTIGSTEYEALRRHGEETYPHESCGVLLGRADGDGRVVAAVARCANTRADSPHNRYGIDPREIIRIERDGRARGLDIVGFYHSHPDHPARPSATDLAEAHWTGCSYVITSVARGSADATRSFVLEGEDEAKRFEDEEVRVAASPAAARPQEEA